jgi:predicted NAD/FAD-binding protein
MSRLAIIGTGIAGMGSAHFLHRHHDLTIFEANDYVGGHTNTVDATEPGTARPVPIDTGFMVYNEVTYPLLTRLFNQLNVPVKKTTMSFAVRDDLTGIEWCGSSLNHLFAQRKNLLNLRFLKMLMAVNRFNKEAIAALNEPETATITLGEYVRRRGYGQDFFDLYLVPMSGAVWSTPPELMLSFPAASLLRFFHNHGFLGLNTQHQWMTVDGGSREYRDRLIAPFSGSIQLGSAVVRIIRNGQNRPITVMTQDGVTQSFDQVIVATHADHALRILVNPTPDEVRLLSEFKYQANVATLHTDAAHPAGLRRLELPARPRHLWPPQPGNPLLDERAPGRLGARKLFREHQPPRLNRSGQGDQTHGLRPSAVQLGSPAGPSRAARPQRGGDGPHRDVFRRQLLRLWLS